MTTKRLLLVAVLFAFSPIQADEQPAQLAAFQPAVGKWVNSERQRESEDAPWETGTSEWEIRFLPGGLVLETPGQIKIGDDEAVSWAQVWGIDPGSGSPYFHVYVSNGTVVTGSFEWSGRTVKMESAATWRDHYEPALRAWVEAGKLDQYYEAPLAQLINAGAVAMRGADVTATWWAEIDNPDDLARAERLLDRAGRV